MPEETLRRLQSLREAASEARWEDFSTIINTWADEEADNVWLRAGRVIADAACGQEVDSDRVSAMLQPVDKRLLNIVEMLNDLRADRRARVRQRVFAESAIADGEQVWIDVLRELDPHDGEDSRHLFATSHLVAGCIMRDDQVISMAVKGSRMTVDILAFQTNLIQEQLDKLLKRIDIGDVKYIHVVGEDGGWIMGKSREDSPRVASALIAAPPMTDTAAARTQVALATGVEE